MRMDELIAELHILEEVCAIYADDEDRFLAGDGEPYGSIPTEAGIKARAARKRVLERMKHNSKIKNNPWKIKN